MKEEQAGLKLFSLWPLKRGDENVSLSELADFIRASEKCGFNGVLIPESNEGSMDAWAFAQMLLSQSKTMHPFVAVNPNYMHPFAVARKIATLTVFYGRRLYLNFITGTARNEAAELGQVFSHTGKYERLTEYIHIIRLLLSSKEKVSFKGSYYEINNLALAMLPPAALLPECYIAGESADALQAAEKTQCLRLAMANPRKMEQGRLCFSNTNKADGFHLGVFARPAAGTIAEEMERHYPADRMAQLLFKYSMAGTEAVWKKKLYERIAENLEDPCYSLLPFRLNHSDLPYLTGSYAQLVGILNDYVQQGLKTLIIEVPATGGDEFAHLSEVLNGVGANVKTV